MRIKVCYRQLSTALLFISVVGIIAGAAVGVFPNAVAAMPISLSSAELLPDTWRCGQAGCYVYGAKVAAPFTVATKWHFQSSFGDGTSDPSSLVLAGLTTLPPASGGLQVLWLPDNAGWFPRWQIVLQVQTPETGTLPSIALVSVTPVPGHTYQTTLSYLAETGAAVVHVQDTTSGEALYSGSVAVPSIPAQLQAVAGYPGANQPALATVIEAMQVFPTVLPAATNWQIGTRASTGDFDAGWRLSSTDGAVIRLDVPAPLPKGQYRVLLANAGRSGELAHLTPQKSGENWLILPAGELPLGQSQLTLEYAENGQVLLSETRDMIIGSLAVRFSPVQIQPVDHTAQTQVWLASKIPLSQQRITVQAILNRLVWDNTAKTYKEQPYSQVTAFDESLALNATDSGTEFTVAVPLPPEPGYWQVAYRLSTELGLSIASVGEKSTFSTYQPGLLQPGQPYSMVVLPDMQLYSWSHPQIFTRMTQWIAENAADRNIGLVLQMGDVTEQNSPAEWERASYSMSLLEGVVPYVLTEGNHDIMLQGGDYSKHSRSATLISKYFPPSRFPNIAGTFEEGKVENSYHTFNIAGVDYMVVSLEYGPRDEVLDWANQVVAAHPDHKVIVITHHYLNRSGLRASPSTGSDFPNIYYYISDGRRESANDGDDMWQKFVRKHKNIFLVVSGHVGVSTVPRLVSVGDHGNFVYQLLVDYQGEPNGGDGWLVLLDFSPDQKVTVRAYSPYQGQYKTGTDNYGFDNHFVIDVNKARFLQPTSD